MKSRFFALLLAIVLLSGLSGCGTASADSEAALTVAATTYPVYLFTTAISDGAEGVAVELVVNQQVSCLHDYTLTIHDMKIIDRADIVVINGAELEEFLDAALDAVDVPVIDCSAQVDLLPYEGHEDHDHAVHEHEHGHYDPHFWLSTEAAAAMLSTIANRLSELDPSHAAIYEENLTRALDSLPQNPLAENPPACPYLITFHDGFQYFAEENGLTILKAIEEEEGSEASARDIKEILALIEEYGLPAIFVEANSSDATAKAIARETGVEVYTLDMIMSGSGSGLQPYLDTMNANYAAIAQALS